MRIELRKSGGDTCHKCGAHELLYTPALNEHLEADVRAYLLQDVAHWRVLRRRQLVRFAGELDRLILVLRNKTRFGVN